MNDKVESRKKKSTKEESPVHVIRQAAVAASIWRRQSPAGYVYYDFSLTRSWKSVSSGNTGYSRNFFVRNRQELQKVIDLATQWIHDHEASAIQEESQVA